MFNDWLAIEISRSGMVRPLDVTLRVTRTSAVEREVTSFSWMLNDVRAPIFSTNFAYPTYETCKRLFVLRTVIEKLPLISVVVDVIARPELSNSTTFAIMIGPSVLLQTRPEILFCANATAQQKHKASVNRYFIFFMILLFTF